MINDEATLNKLIVGYITLRDKRDKLKKEQAEVIAEYDTIMDRIENYLMGHLRAQKLTNIACEAGVAFIKRSRKATFADAQTFREFVIANQNFDLADFRARVEAVEAYVEDNDGQLPPGVNFRTYDVVQINRK